MVLSRRHFVMGGAALAAAGLPFLFKRKSHAASATLIPDPEGILDLPAGFRYRVLSRSGQPMTDGFRVPSLPDGMACFPGAPGQLILLRNHEVTRSYGSGAYSRGNAPPEAFDPSAFGAVTRVVLDEKSLTPVSSNLVLTGTIKNCSGGPTPWGWLTCEETSEAGHGYVFLCRTEADRVRPPERITGYGRFAHEAVAFDPGTRIAYLTEDRADSCLYRFVPVRPDDAFSGKLYALRVKGSDRLDASKAISPGQKVEVDWVELPDPDPKKDSLRSAAQALGAATFNRGEGAFFGGGSAYFVATSGGKSGRGQLFRLTPSPEHDTLEVVCEAGGESSLDGPDNVTLAPFGDVVLAEDGSGDNYVRGLTPRGRLYDIARNAASRFEIAGICFSPDGGTLFLNLQADGLTLAVRGPFATLGQMQVG
jgi:secreted PhoX family phosphatase